MSAVARLIIRRVFIGGTGFAQKAKIPHTEV
jgi:hypothetical protein